MNNYSLHNRQKGFLLTMFDPTYSGRSRKTLQALFSNRSNEDHVTFFSTPVLSGRPQRGIGGGAPPRFADKHEVGYSRFDHKGSVLFANIDAVLNLTKHVGGYFATSTQNDNMHFYSLLFEDRNLELYSYLQWRLPYSISRSLITSSVGRPDLEGVNLDIVDSNSSHTLQAIMEGRPMDGYHIVGISSHVVLPLRTLVLTALVMFSTLSSKPDEEGAGFLVFPYGATRERQESLSVSALTDYIVFLSSLFQEVYMFRPYMCYSFICIGVKYPKKYPAKDSPEESHLISLWSSVISNQERDFGRIFDVIDPRLDIPQKIIEIIQAKEPLGRDRVEVLSRWQLPDQFMSFYPKFKQPVMMVDDDPLKLKLNKNKDSRKFRHKGKPKINTP